MPMPLPGDRNLHFLSKPLPFRSENIWMPQFPVVGMDRVEGGQGVVRGHAVLGGKHGTKGPGFFQEEGVMAHAEAQEDVEIRPDFI